MSANDPQGQKHFRELAVLNTIAAEFNRSVDLDEILQAALEQTGALFGLQTGWIWLLDEDSGKSYLAAAQNLPPALVEEPRRMENQSCYCLNAYRAGDLQGSANIDVITCSRLEGLVDGTDGLHCHASVPLYAQDKKLGILNVASADWQQLSTDDLRLLHTVGDLLSMAIERARLYGKSLESGAAEERYRLARELHDTLGQGLTAILLKLETIDALLERGVESEAVRALMAETMALGRRNVEEARRSVLDLRAVPLEGRSLEEALKGLAEETGLKEKLQVEFESVGGNRPLPVRIETGLFRMAQEGLNNAVQHAGSQRIRLQLIAVPGKIRLLVDDDGRGFDPDQVPAGRYGLVGISERARLLGGSAQLDSAPGQGTHIEISVPLEAE